MSKLLMATGGDGGNDYLLQTGPFDGLAGPVDDGETLEGAFEGSMNVGDFNAIDLDTGSLVFGGGLLNMTGSGEFNETGLSSVETFPRKKGRIFKAIIERPSGSACMPIAISTVSALDNSPTPHGEQLAGSNELLLWNSAAFVNTTILFPNGSEMAIALNTAGADFFYKMPAGAWTFAGRNLTAVGANLYFQIQARGDMDLEYAAVTNILYPEIFDVGADLDAILDPI